MEKLEVVTIKVSSRDQESKKYVSLLSYAVAEVNKLVNNLYDEYTFINVIPNITVDSLSMTDYCELVAFLSVSKYKQDPLECKYARRGLDKATMCGYYVDTMFIRNCTHIGDTERCPNFVKKPEK